MTFTCRKLVIDDLDLLRQALQWHSTKYGFKFDQEKLYETFVNFIEKGRHDYVTACFKDDEILAVNTHKSWDSAPFWTFGRLIVKPTDRGQGIMTEEQLRITQCLTDYNCELAESEGRYDWFIVSQDSSKTKNPRDAIVLKNVYPRYNVNCMYKYMPGEICPWKTFNAIYSQEMNPHKKPLILRMFSLKDEFRLNML